MNDIETKELNLAASDKVALVLHGIDTVWRSWQYGLDRSREFLVLLSALAGGLFALFADAKVNRLQAILVTVLGITFSSYWLFLNVRWARVIQRLTQGMHDSAREFGLSDFHPYLRQPWGGLTGEPALTGAPKRWWWAQGTMALPIIYLIFFVALAVYFAVIVWPAKPPAIPGP